MRFGLALLVVLAALSATPALSQSSADDGVQQEAAPTKKIPKQPKPTVSTPKGPVCYDITLTLDPIKWDPWPGSRGNPDPIIRELTTGFETRCVDSYSCSFQMVAKGKLEFLLTDDDPDKDDPIGHALCTAGKACRVGQSTLSFSKC